LARSLVRTAGAILIIAVEAPSLLLALEPGPAGEAAALFGDGAAASLISDHAVGNAAVPLIDVTASADGSGAHLLQVKRGQGGLAVEFQGRALAARAVRTMADNVHALRQKHRLRLSDISGIVAHGGNGRMPDLLARSLGIPAECVWSEAARLGNLGTASLPVAWAMHGPATGPVIWTAVGAGLTWGAALTGPSSSEGDRNFQSIAREEQSNNLAP
jgi:3-oxoacyl-[acyl-carrier-protein] synthase-3